VGSVYMLNDIDSNPNRSDISLDIFLSISALFTYIANISTAMETVEDYNKNKEEHEIKLFIEGLDSSPSGVKLKNNL